MEWMLMPLRRYADFQGRSRRMEYWMFALGYTLVLLVLAALAGVFASFGRTDGGTVGGGGGALSMIALVLLIIFVLGLLVPALAVQVRRFHDQDKSGWFVLLNFIPYVGGLIVLVMMCLPGTAGPNRFGPDPINPTGNLKDVFS